MYKEILRCALCKEAKLTKMANMGKQANHQKFSIGLANIQIECQKVPLAE